MLPLPSLEGGAAQKPEIWRYIEEIPDLVASTAFEDFPLMSYWESSFSKVAEVVTAALE